MQEIISFYGQYTCDFLILKCETANESEERLKYSWMLYNNIHDTIANDLKGILVSIDIMMKKLLNDTPSILLLSHSKFQNLFFKLTFLKYGNYLLTLILPSNIKDNVCKTLLCEIFNTFLLFSSLNKDFTELSNDHKRLLANITYRYLAKLKDFFVNDKVTDLEFAFALSLHANCLSLELGLDMNLSSEIFAIGNEVYDDTPDLINTLNFDDFYIGPIGLAILYKGFVASMQMPVDDFRDCMKIMNIAEDQDYLYNNKLHRQSYFDNKAEKKLLFSRNKGNIAIVIVFIHNGNHFELHEKIIGNQLNNLIELQN